MQAETNADGFSITTAPLYYDGLVITGFAGGDRGSRGRVKAFDARTGKLVWTFYTIPGPGELGHDTWPADNDTWKYGGAAVWQTPAVDPELGPRLLLDGQSGPRLERLRAPRRQPVQRLDASRSTRRPGKYRWHFQQVHHDIWDYDSPNPVILFDAMYDGKPRKGIAEVGKTGFVYILDRETGKPLVGIEERAGAAGAAPGDGRDAAVSRAATPVVPHEIDIVARGLRAREQRPHLHAVLGQARGREAARHRRRELAAELRTIPRRIFSTSARTTARPRTRRRKAASSG